MKANAKHLTHRDIDQLGTGFDIIKGIAETARDDEGLSRHRGGLWCWGTLTVPPSEGAVKKSRLHPKAHPSEIINHLLSIGNQRQLLRTKQQRGSACD